MTPELLALLGSIAGGTGALLSYWAGWRARGAQRPPRGSYGRCLDPDWRRSFNHENTNRPSGPPPLNLRRSEPVRMDEGPTTPKPLIVTVKGLNWPATLGDFTLVGPADNQGAWRWYERHHRDGTTERVRVDHQLQPLGHISVGYQPRAQGGTTNPPPREP